MAEQAKKPDPTEAQSNSAAIMLDDFLDKYREQHAEREEHKQAAKEVTERINADLAEMKAQGFDVKVLRKLAAIAVETPEETEERHEHEALLAVYKDATGIE